MSSSRKSVVFPLPLGPTRATRSPNSTSRLALSKIGRSPYAKEKSLTETAMRPERAPASIPPRKERSSPPGRSTLSMRSMRASIAFARFAWPGSSYAFAMSFKRRAWNSMRRISRCCVFHWRSWSASASAFWRWKSP